MRNTIIEAIKRRICLDITYSNIQRIVQPHTFGVNHMGNEVLSCYQTEGGHASKATHTWDLFVTSKITAISLTGSTFETDAPGYTKADSRMKNIYAEV